MVILNQTAELTIPAVLQGSEVCQPVQLWLLSLRNLFFIANNILKIFFSKSCFTFILRLKKKSQLNCLPSNLFIFKQLNLSLLESVQFIVRLQEDKSVLFGFSLSIHPKQPTIVSISTAVRFTIYMQSFPLLQAFTPLRMTTYVCHRTEGEKLFFVRLTKMQSLLILMCFGIKLNRQQQLGSESKGITSSTKTCSPTSILSNLQAQ